MTTDLGSRISESDDPEPVDSSLVREIVDAVNAQLEEYAAANGALTDDATREMARNLVMRQLEEITFTSADAGRGVMSASDEIAVTKPAVDSKESPDVIEHLCGGLRYCVH